MRERWMALDLGQRRLVAGLVALLLVVGTTTGAIALAHRGGDHQTLATAGAATSTSTTDGSSTTAAATSSTAPGSTSTAADGSSTTSTTAKGKHKAPGGGSVTATTARSGGGRLLVTTTTAPHPTSTTAAAGACSTGGSGQDDQIASLFCSYRRDQGLAPMSRNSALDGVAQRWANQMAKDADAAVASGQDPSVALAHNLSSNPEATYPGGYVAAVQADCGRCTGWSENVAYNTSASAAWNGWLGSSTHREDIRGGPDGGEFGVGAAQGGGYWWYVQDFGYYP